MENDDEKEKGATASTDNAPRTSKSTVAAVKSAVKAAEILEPSLPKLKPPRNLNEARARLMEGQREIIGLAGQAGRRFYAQGDGLQLREGENRPRQLHELDRGERRLSSANGAALYAILRSVQRCGKTSHAQNGQDQNGHLVPFATRRIGHRGGRASEASTDSKEWNASDCAQALFKRFENLTARRTTDERWEVLEGFHDLARDFINSRDKDREAIRGNK
jgi:hypothetical protein